MIYIYYLVWVVLALFVYWRKLKDDYLPKQIFNSFFIPVFLVSVPLFVFWKSTGPYIFWILSIGFLILNMIVSKRQGIKANEAGDGAFIALLLVLLGYYFINFYNNFGLEYGLALLTVTVPVALYYYLNAEYKSFLWYRSGKIGFAACVSGGLMYLLRGILSFFFKIPTFVGGLEAIFAGTIAFIFFVLLYNLSRQ